LQRAPSCIRAKHKTSNLNNAIGTFIKEDKVPRQKALAPSSLSIVRQQSAMLEYRTGWPGAPWICATGGHTSLQQANQVSVC
jgi:hypothetical protein